MVAAAAAAVEVDHRSPDAVTAAVGAAGAAAEAVAAADICCQVGLAAVAVAVAGLPRILPAERAWSATCGGCSLLSG